MKKLILFLTFICVAAFSYAGSQTILGDSTKFYGAKITEDGAISPQDLQTKLKNAKEITAKVRGKIITTCKKKGCWMTMEIGSQTMTVKFKDYGFFVPKEGMEGKEVIIEGVAKKETRSVEELRHYAEDAGKSKQEIKKIKKAQDEITFTANGVIIK